MPQRVGATGGSSKAAAGSSSSTPTAGHSPLKPLLPVGAPGDEDEREAEDVLGASLKGVREPAGARPQRAARGGVAAGAAAVKGGSSGTSDARGGRGKGKDKSGKRSSRKQAAAGSNPADDPKYMPRKGKHAPLEGLKAFMYVPNARWKRPKAGEQESPDAPRYWVGRVTEITRHRKCVLHWYRETSPGSGLYKSTNHHFAEKIGALRQFRTAVRDKAAKGWRLYPIV